MIIRWNRKASRIYWMLVVFLIGCALSVAAWLSSVPRNSRSVGPASHFSNRPVARPLLTKKQSKDSNEAEDKPESGGFFKSFRGDSSKDNPPKQKDKSGEAEEEQGLFRGIQRRFEKRKESREAKLIAEREKKLKEAMDRENREANPLLKAFNASGIAAAIQEVEAGLSQARDELRSVRANQAIREEEKKLEELRKQALKEREKRIRAQKLADRRTMERREKKRKQLLERETKTKEKAELKRKIQAASKETKKEPQDADAEDSKRSNPLSVAQKFIANVLEKQSKEEWIVVAPKTRIMPGEIVPISAAGLDLLLVASKDGSALHCIANSCPHLGTPLEVGVLERRPIEPSDSSSNFFSDQEFLQEKDIARLLAQDGCEDCIVCPLHKTAFALESGEVRGEWCPYPPVLGKVMGNVKRQSSLPVFDVRTRGKNIEVRLNTPFQTDPK